jgi:MFS family permease
LNERAKIGISKMFILGVGWMGVQFFWGFHTSSMPLFLARITDSKTQIAIVLSLAGVAGCIVPPIVGYLSDRTKGRFGRRRPYIILGMLGTSICMFFLPNTATYMAALTMSGLMYFCLRAAETPYLSLLPDLTPPDQRGTASGIMNLVGGLGLIACFVIGEIVWKTNPANFFYIVAAVSFASVLAATSLIREPDAPPAEPGSKGSPLDYLKGIAEESSAMRFFLAQFFWWLGLWVATTFVPLFISEELGAPEEQVFAVMGVFAIVMIASVLPLGILGDKVSRKGLLSVMVGLWGISYIVVGLAQNLTQVLWLVGLTAVPFAAVMGVGLAYLLDLIPPERTAEFMGFSVISIAAAQVIGPVIGGIVIDSLGFRALFPATAAFMWVGLILLQFVRPQKQSEPAPAD